MPTFFPQPTQPPYLQVHLLGVGIISALLLYSVIILWPKWRTRVWDGVLWIVAAFIATAVLNEAAPRHMEVTETIHRYGIVIWSLIGLGCFVSFYRIRRAGDGLKTAKYLGLMALMSPILLGFLLPAVTSGREPSRFLQCKTNLLAIGLALDHYREIHRALPSQQSGDPPHSWRVALLPYVDQKPLYDRYQFGHAWDATENEESAMTSIPDYMCPSYIWDWKKDPRKPTSYALLTGPHAFWTPDGPRKWDLAPHGASNTAMIVEACGQNIVWTEPRDIDTETTPVAINTPGTGQYDSPAMFSSHHHRGVNVLMTDGSVRRVPLHTDPNVLKAMIQSQ